MNILMQSRHPDNYYKYLIHRMDLGYVLIEMIFDNSDKPVDIYFIEANPAANRMAGTQLTENTQAN